MHSVRVVKSSILPYMASSTSQFSMEPGSVALAFLTQFKVSLQTGSVKHLKVGSVQYHIMQANPVNPEKADVTPSL